MSGLPARQFARVTSKRLAREFKGDLTMVGLARKYALTQPQVEDWIRSVAGKPDAHLAKWGRGAK